MNTNSADKALLLELKQALPPKGAIAFIDTHNFAFSYELKRFNDFVDFVAEWDNAKHKFQDASLEKKRVTLLVSVNNFLNVSGKNSFSTARAGWVSVNEEWETENPKLFRKTIKDIRTAADAAVAAYKALVKPVKK
jgi:hypothetical protein